MNYENKLSAFLKENTKKTKKIIVIYGPTACGKTSLSIEIAKKLNTEIISTDSRQIFKDLDIGTGKIKEGEKEGIIHHMLDIVSPNEKFSVGAYKKIAIPHLEEIWKKGKIPLLVGGTGLYIDSLIYDFQIPTIPGDENLRQKLEEEAKKYGNEYIYEKLISVDPDFAKTLHPNNLRYVIRALEIKLLSGKSKGDFKKEKILKYPTLFITPYNGDREKLYNNINTRVQMMFDEGLVDEVKGLLHSKYSQNDFGLQTIGYSEVIEYLDGKISLDEAIALVQKNSRNYAKRQLTWFRNYEK